MVGVWGKVRIGLRAVAAPAPDLLGENEGTDIIRKCEKCAAQKLRLFELKMRLIMRFSSLNYLVLCEIEENRAKRTQIC